MTQIYIQDVPESAIEVLAKAIAKARQVGESTLVDCESGARQFLGMLYGYTQLAPCFSSVKCQRVSESMPHASSASGYYDENSRFHSGLVLTVEEQPTPRLEGDRDNAWGMAALRTMLVIEVNFVPTRKQTSRVIILEVVFAPRAEIQSEIELATLANCSDRVPKTAS